MCKDKICLSIAYNVLRLPVVGVWNTQLSIPANVYLKIQNFILPRPRQLLVGAVGSSYLRHGALYILGSLISVKTSRAALGMSIFELEFHG